jgi:OmpR-family two-component system manganese-sensing response regulator
MSEPPDRADTARPLAPTRLLVVDDDTCMFDIFHQMFPAPDYAVATASHGRGGILLANAQLFDVAFVDFYLAGMSGVEVAQGLRRAQSNLKIVLMSGFLVENRAAMIQEAGASAFLTKPFDASAARAAVARLLATPKPEARA